MGETFLWYRVNPRLTVGVAHLWKQNAFRGLAAYQIAPEKGDLPMINASIGLQGIGTGNPGLSLTAEKNFSLGKGIMGNAYVGAGYRTNENHLHPVGGFKISPDGKLYLGVQHDGHQTHPFATYSVGQMIGGVYLINGKRLAYMLGARF